MWYHLLLLRFGVEKDDKHGDRQTNSFTAGLKISVEVQRHVVFLKVYKV